MQFMIEYRLSRTVSTNKQIWLGLLSRGMFELFSILNAWSLNSGGVLQLSLIVGEARINDYFELLKSFRVKGTHIFFCETIELTSTLISFIKLSPPGGR